MYTAIHVAQLDSATLSRLLLAYTCLYHLGAATTIAMNKGGTFWEHLQLAADNPNLAWPRGTERRHWRGENAQKTMRYIRMSYEKPEDVVARWSKPTSLSFNSVAARVKELPAYGPWIAFKVADLLERVAGVPVDFSDCALGVYDEPRKAAALLITGNQDAKITDGELMFVVIQLLKALGKLKAPPTHNRIINIQEVETVLCKYKSHVNGHYPIGKDTKEVLHGLQDKRWSNKVTDRMLKTIEVLPYAH